MIVKKNQTVLIAERKFINNNFLKRKLKKKFKNILLTERTDLLNIKKIDYSKINGIILGLQNFDKKIIDKFSKLKVIAKFGVGLDNIDLNYCKKKNIKVCKATGCNAVSVSELVVGNILNLIRNINENHNSLKRFIWKPTKGHELFQKKVGIIGLGTIGKKVVDRLYPFECQLYYYDIIRNIRYEKKYKIKYISYKKLLENCDVLSFHVPLTKKTYQMVNKSSIKKIKKGAILINTSRGDVLNLNLLKKYIKTKHLKVGLDVFSPEPYLNRKLLNHNNAIFTPHIGGTTEEAILRIGEKNIQDLYNNL